MTSGLFRQFDHGSPAVNEKYYGSGVLKPPEYNLSKITAPVVLFWGENDNLATKLVGENMSEIYLKSLKYENLIFYFFYRTLGLQHLVSTPKSSRKTIESTGTSGHIRISSKELMLIS